MYLSRPKRILIWQGTEIVVTNPPFSLFREYVAQHIKYEKKFLIIGNLNAITYKEIPCDYNGVMAVPITFIDKYNPNQFEILGDSRYHDGQDFADDINVLNGRTLYRRILIRRKQTT